MSPFGPNRSLNSVARFPTGDERLYGCCALALDDIAKTQTMLMTWRLIVRSRESPSPNRAESWSSSAGPRLSVGGRRPGWYRGAAAVGTRPVHVVRSKEW